MKILIILYLTISSYGLASEYLIKSKGYLDVRGKKIITGQYIHVKNTKIIAISTTSPRSAKIIDLSNYYILPGFIDSHTHLFITQLIRDLGFENAIGREAKIPNEIRIKRAKIFLKQYLREGFTTVFDLGNSGYFLDTKLRDEIANNLDFPILLTSGPGIATVLGQFLPKTPLNIVLGEYSIIDYNTDLKSLLIKYKNSHVDILKIYLDNSPGVGAMPDLLLSKLLAAIPPKYFKKITFHSITLDGANLIDKYNLEHIEHLSHFNIQSKFPKLKFATPADLDKLTLINFKYFSPVSYLTQINRTHHLNSTSVKILFGPDMYFDTGVPGFNRAHYVKRATKALRDSGLTPFEIIESMTINPALSVGMENQIGQISPGSYANLIATKKNPLKFHEAIENISFVMNRGRIISPH